MAVVGRKSAPADQRRNRVKSDIEWVEVVDVPYLGDRPELPETRTVVTRDGQETVTLQKMTRDWWGVISTMPHCVLWSKADWMFALASAVVADAAFCGIASAATELRQREKDMGATVEYRRANKIRYVDPVEESVDHLGVTSLDQYRDL